MLQFGKRPGIPHNKTIPQPPSVSSAMAENPPPISARRTLDQAPHRWLQLTPDSWNIPDTLHGQRRLRLSTSTHSCHSTVSTAFPHLLMQDKPIVGPTRGALRFPTARTDLGVGGGGDPCLPTPTLLSQVTLKHSSFRLSFSAIQSVHIREGIGGGGY